MFGIRKVLTILKYGSVVAKVLDTQGINVKGVPISKVIKAVETALTSEQHLEPLIKQAVHDIKDDLI